MSQLTFMRTTLDSLAYNYRFAISTDIVGVYGNPEDVIGFLKKVGIDPHLVGIEVLAWMHIFKNYTSFFEYFGCQVAGIHGQTGTTLEKGVDRADDWKVWLLNKYIHDVPEMLAIANWVSETHQHPVYTVVHGPRAQRLHAADLQSANQEVIPAVENHVDRNAFGQTQAIVSKLNSEGARSGFVFDVAHFLKEGTMYPNLQKWHEMIAVLDSLGQCIIHLPIGTAAHDSLPFEQVTDDMWRELARVIQKNHCFVTLEHQHSQFLANIIANPQDNPQIINAYQKKLKKLVDMGIVTLERENVLY